MKTMSIRFLLTSLLVLAIPSSLSAEVPSTLHYQGEVAVEGQPVTGDYDFKFALVDGGTENVETAQATATISGGFVTVLTITDPGNGYLDRPAVTISGGGGSGATAEAVIENGQVTSVDIVDPGSGYTSTPEVAIEAPPSATIASLWSNDGSSSGGAMPSGAVALSVHDGVFSVVLGDDSLVNMTSLPAPETLEDPVFLRVWFDDGTGFQQLTPDQPLTAVPFAMKAASANAALAAEFATEAEALASTGTSGFSLSPSAEGGAVLETGGEPAVRIGVGGDYEEFVPIEEEIVESSAGPTIIAGSSANETQENSDSEIPLAAVIAGGGLDSAPNIVSHHFTTVSGGRGNTASNLQATVGGGKNNTASGIGSTVGGGEDNTASGNFSMIPGGISNSTEDDISFAAGFRAKALHHGTFVWADFSFTNFESTGNDQFLIRAGGGVGIGTNNPQSALDVAGSVQADSVGVNTNSPATALHLGELNTASGTPDGLRFESSNGQKWDIHLSSSWLRFNTHESGGTSENVAYVRDTDGSWNTASDRRLKENITQLTPALEDVLKIEPVRYDFKNRESTPDGHIGFIAQDVHSLFPEMVTTGETEGDFWGVNYAGFSVIAIKAIQEQQAIIETQGERITELEARVNEQEALAERVAQLEAALLENNAALAASQP